jgi:nitroreductase
LAELFDLTALAPSVGNCQPTRFVRVDDKARRASILVRPRESAQGLSMPQKPLYSFGVYRTRIPWVM